MPYSISGTVCLEITSADNANLFQKLNNKGIVLQEVSCCDTLTIFANVQRKDMDMIFRTASECGATIKVKKKKGLFWLAKRFQGRPVLVLGLLFTILMVVLLPTRVLFISVEGNETIPDRQIMECAKQCGIVFGASRRQVRSEKMKNRLLGAIPSLQWAGINTSGCTAVISVKERSDTGLSVMPNVVSNIIAVRDGIIESCTVFKGELLCKTGQAVAKGDILISGYSDYGICAKVTKADGEIVAQTKYDLTVLTPLEYRQKRSIQSVNKKYSLTVGKKRINFNKCSGISGSVCDKMYTDYVLTLPGGFCLPITLHVTVTTVYDDVSWELPGEDAKITAAQTAQRYILSRMISGKILRENFSFFKSNQSSVYSAQYVCSEMIGRTQYEEIDDKYGEDN